MKTIPNPTHPELPALVPNREYARRIGVSVRTLYNYDRLGLLPPPVVVRGRMYRDPSVLPAQDAGAAAPTFRGAKTA